ncbi:hypothetical protein Tco_0064531 [Tanacetum coccineum]
MALPSYLMHDGSISKSTATVLKHYYGGGNHHWLSRYLRDFPKDKLNSGIDRACDRDFFPTSLLKSLESGEWICQISKEISQKRTRERMSDQEAKDLKAEAREIMPQPSTVKPQSTQSQASIVL